MKKLKVDIENCYGIKKLQKEFDFSDEKVYAIYAPNGAMKSSFAQLFKDVSDAKESKDRIFPTRISRRKITDENNADLPKESVLVVRPYDEILGHTEKTSTLLLDSKLREEYEQLLIEIDKSKEIFVKALKEQSHSKKDLEKEISSAFTKIDTDFYLALIRVKDEVLAQKDAPFAGIYYDRIFDEKVLTFLGTKDFKTLIEEYIKRYNELLSASTYFKKGIFNYYNASTIAKSLADNGFFAANHTVRLNADENIEITSVKQLEELIAKEKESISKDKTLRNKFKDVEKLIKKNSNVRDFEAYITEHEELLPELANIELFKEKIWKSYFCTHIELYKDLIGKYQSAEKRKQEIEDAAAKQRTLWEKVIEIFNNRFFVPFKLIAKNKVSVTLGQEKMLTLGFTFEDGGDNADVEKQDLMQILSTGEKKALYILNIIFEIEARKKSAEETIYVIDDIADSFDYKNKYAIIQYLKDISEEQCFKQIILTHNFDFFRTINSRFVKYSQCLMAFKNSTGVTLQQASGIQNVFVKDWKPNFFKDPKKKISSIPFMRNIIEYTKGNKDKDFNMLTSLLHWKSNSKNINESDLDDIFYRTFNVQKTSNNGNIPVIDIVRLQADECLKDGDGINFENKIVLSIAIRLAAEKFMFIKINDPSFVDKITTNQTPILLKKFEDKFSSETSAIKTIQQVILMTPENIHLNSFMYEPILDMSDEHLKRLYKDVLNISQKEKVTS